MHDADFTPQRPPRPKRRGVIPAHQVRLLSFVVISLSLFWSAGLCMLAVWDKAEGDVAWRAITSLGVIAGTMFAFTLLNETFGKKLEPQTRL